MTHASLLAVETAEHRAAAEALVAEYLRWVGHLAKSEYGLEFDIDAMVRSDIDDPAKFYPPTGRFYLVRSDGQFVGIGCLKQLSPGVGEVQRMYVRPQARGAGAGRLVVNRLLEDARALGYRTVRLESLRALQAAHRLYRSVGFVEIDPYAGNSMSGYQDTSAHAAYRASAVFMELRTS
ncbi:MAG TPA: GNAT family N-acetyltransferase [Ramlibacter sp.]|uniref:GNAT family N-acetyltransferase n=1 Tax=Ramlibacter sp. TaxID=1917967 RepID=UPI002BD56F5D|nr:GNAT family N-acetyltransferase [Ramlibacter sp.]HVZ44065.1 GNAT family N-acetyltransferase [Ramlibacter sp.]